jgi:alanine racemase
VSHAVERFRPTVAEIDLGAIRHNIETLGSFLAPDVERLAVVKANAYGHGVTEVARAAIDAGATRLGVALVEEGIALRNAGFDVPIVMLVEPPLDAASAVVEHRITPSISTKATAHALSEAASLAGTTLPVHVCVDTGMHREGFVYERGVDCVREVASLPGLEVEGLWSHFALGEQAEHPFTARQIELFAELADDVAKAGIDVPVRHLTSSAGIVLYPDSHFDLVRMGLMLYGLYPDDALVRRCELRPALRLTSAVSLTRRLAAGEGISYGLTWAPDRDVTIANIPIGYGDGFARMLSSRGDVLIGGTRRRIAGRVTMDTTMAVCDDDDVAVGDEVVLIGTQGTETITATEIAQKINTINYEVACSIGPRVPRRFVP